MRHAIAFLAGAICLTEHSSLRAAPGPKVEVVSHRVSVGTLNRGQTAEASFVLRNTGDEVLRILEARPG